VAASVAVNAGVREAAGGCWRQRGMTYVAVRGAGSAPLDTTGRGACGGVDSATTAAVARGLAPVVAIPPRRGTDPTGEYVRVLLSCPSLALRDGGRGLLDSRCNRR
jgi:hypothetical protein